MFCWHVLSLNLKLAKKKTPVQGNLNFFVKKEKSDKCVKSLKIHNRYKISVIN
jgi:hypothetical protein